MKPTKEYRTLRGLLGSFKKAGYGVRKERLEPLGLDELVIPIPKDWAMYEVHVKQIMKLGKFDHYSIQNGEENGLAEIWFAKRLKK